MTVIFGDRQTAWSPDSLALISARYARPLEHSLCRSCLSPRKRRGSSGLWVGAHRWCGPCTNRWYDAGRPDSGPPPPMTAEQRAARMREAADLRDLGDLTTAQPSRDRRPLTAGSWGYRPSTGTAGTGEAA